jgi:hypothetical protein
VAQEEAQGIEAKNRRLRVFRLLMPEVDFLSTYEGSHWHAVFVLTFQPIFLLDKLKRSLLQSPAHWLKDIVAQRFYAGVRSGEQVASGIIAVHIAPDMRMGEVTQIHHALRTWVSEPHPEVVGQSASSLAALCHH